MVIQRGEIWWASLPKPARFQPGFRRPVLIVQADEFNRSRINTVIALVITSDLRLAAAPGNVLLPAKSTGLPKDSVANVSQLITTDKNFLNEKVGRVNARQMQTIAEGLRLVLGL